MPNLKQNSDGTESILNAANGSIAHFGGTLGAAGTNIPDYPNVNGMRFNLAGGTDTAGGILGFTLPFSYDIIIIGAQLDVQTVASAACTVSIGQNGTGITTSASNLISAQDVHSATGQFSSAALLAVLAPAGTFITASKASGASAALVGVLFLQFMRAS